MEPDARQAIAEINGRLDDLKDQFYKANLKVTNQLARMATTLEHQAKPEPKSFMQEQLIRAGIHMLSMAIIGLFLFWLSHEAHAP